MVDTNFSQSFIYNVFKGLDYRDDEEQLELGKTPNAKNFEIVYQYGIGKRNGNQKKISLDPSYRMTGSCHYSDSRNNHYYLVVAYPFIGLISKATGAIKIIYSGLRGEGEPYFIHGLCGDILVVDGVNKPVFIHDGVATQSVWPPAYPLQNSQLLNQSPNTVSTNPTTLGVDVGYPSFGVFYGGRYYVSGDSLTPTRFYASAINSGIDYSTNSSLDRSIPFYMTVMSNSPIVGLANLNNQYMIIFCENEIHQVTGVFPDGGYFPEPKIRIRQLIKSLGCIGKYAFTQKGNTDLFFLSDKKTLYTLSSTENFQDTRPLGLSEIIFPALDGISTQQFKRSILVNHEIKGELQIYYPSDDERYYPNQRWVYNYSESGQDPEWGLDTDFNIAITSAYIDKETGQQIIATSDAFYISDLGTTYNGKNIDFLYQLSTLDFGDKDKNKEILGVEIGYRLKAGATTLNFYHLWEDGSDGLKQIPLTRTVQAAYGKAVYGTDVYSSPAGKLISCANFKIDNPQGRTLKVMLRHQDSTDLFIAYIKFRYRVMGTNQ